MERDLTLDMHRLRDDVSKFIGKLHLIDRWSVLLGVRKTFIQCRWCLRWRSLIGKLLRIASKGFASIENRTIARASTQISIETFFDVLHSRRSIALRGCQCSVERHHHSGCAEAALRAEQFSYTSLSRMNIRFIHWTQSFDGHDMASINRTDRC